jgi:hypothetical protein
LAGLCGTRAIDQLGHTLTCIIHAFAETEDEAKIFMAKWDIKDGFWRMARRDRNIISPMSYRN